MNDFDYDVVQKKRTARGAAKKKTVANRSGVVCRVTA